MKNKKKKRGIIITVTVFMFLLAVIGTSFFVKKDWIEAMTMFGPLNIEEIDGASSENSHISYFTLSEKKDYYLSGSVTVRKGNVSCIITCDGTKIYENDFSTGNNQIETDVFKNKTGEICIELFASDDVDGEYNIIVHTRESVFNHFIRRIKEYL